MKRSARLLNSSKEFVLLLHHIAIFGLGKICTYEALANGLQPFGFVYFPTNPYLTFINEFIELLKPQVGFEPTLSRVRISVPLSRLGYWGIFVYFIIRSLISSRVNFSWSYSQ